MDMRHVRVIIGLAVTTMLVLGSITAASAYYATGISSKKVYNFQAAAPGGPITSSLFYDFSGGASLGGIAVSNGYAFISDTTDTSGLLHILRLGSSTPYIGSITLKSDTAKVMEAGAVAVDANGGVYVLDKSASTSSVYAYVTSSNWANTASAVVNFGSIGGYTPQVGIATYQGGGAAILSGGVDPYNNSYAAKVNGTTGNAPTPVDSGVIDSSIPSAITIDPSSGNAYVVTRPSDVAVKYGTLFARGSGLGSLGVGLDLSGIPHTISLVKDGSVDYLAILGKGTNGGLQGWKIAMNSGLPTGVVSTLNIDSTDNSPLHSSVATSDGKMLWFTSPASQQPQSQKTVGTIDISSWDPTGHATMNFVGLADGVSAIAAYDAVPEPSSLISLLGLTTGALALLRRRTRS